MAVADLIKAFSLPESSLRGSSTSSTAQVVGLLSVLAISGSVALLTLAGKLKVNEDASPDASEPSKPSKTDGSDRFIKDGQSREPSAPLKVDGGDGLHRAMDGRDRPVRRKKVRFAESVVEPRGNSHDYRLRFAHNGKEEPLNKHRNNIIPANRMALYKGLRQYRLQHSASFLS